MGNAAAGKVRLYKAKETVEILGIEVFATGVHNGDTYDVADLEQMVGAADKVGFEAPLKLGHMEDDDTAALLKKEGMPAFGWVRNLRVQGKKLLADFMEVPKRLADLIKKGAYRRVSAEIYWNFQKGKDVFPRVLKAVSLLGAEIPAVTDLAGIEALYKKLGLEAKGKDEAGHEFRTYMGEAWGGLQLKRKEDVAYRLSDGTLERCGTCRFYLGNAELGAVGACTLVHGEIAAEGICDLYEAREAYLFPGGVEEGEAEAARGKKKKAPRTYTIEKRGDKWCLIAQGSGETLGCHPTEGEAQAQEAAIKAKKGGYGQDERLVLWMSREAVARACPACAEKMAFAGIRALKVTYDPATKLYAGFSEGLCTKFSPGEGFRTRCMESSVGQAADEPGAMCNSLKTWCFDNGYLESKESEGQGAKAHGKTAGAAGAAHPPVGEGAREMEPKDKEIAELKAKVTELETKLTSQRANESALTMELPALKQQLTELQEENRKIRADRRSDRIKTFVADLVRQKRIVPAMAGEVTRDLEHCDDAKVITFQLEGKDIKQTQLEARMAFYGKLPVQGQFVEKELTRGEGSGHAEGAEDTADIKADVHRKVVKYQNEHGGPTKMEYKAAFEAIMAADQDLKERYALAGR
jgi:hypothetical protein